ncbi:MAG: hypothetical protein AAF297_04860 [Planctomycetota bacterium]
MNTTRNLAVLVGTAALALTLAACEQSTTEAAAAESPAWMLAVAPEGVQPVASAKSTAAEGDTITLRGFIGGTMEPLSPDSPVFRIVDPSLVNVCTAEDDHCKTPWDYCCAMPEEISANSATVQIVGASTPGPLSPLDEIIVTGTVGPRPTDQVLTVQATGIYRVDG